MGWSEWSALIVLSVLWGGSFYFNEIALTGLTTFVIVAVRVLIAAIVLWIFVLLKKYPIPRSGHIWASFLVMGLLNNSVPFVLIVWGQTQIASGLASILNAATPIFTVVVAGVLLRDEPLTRKKLLGSICGLVGVAILIGPSALAGLSSNLIAQLAIILAALSYAFAGVFGRRFRTMKVNPIVAAAGQLLMSSLIMIPIALAFGSPSALGSPGLDVWAAIAGLAILSTALAYVLYFRLLDKAGATNLMLVTLLIPVTAILLGSLFLGERLGWPDFAGMFVIGLGLLIIDGRVWRYLARRASSSSAM